MSDAGVITVTDRRGAELSFAVSFTVTEFDPTTREGSDRMDRIGRALIGDRIAVLMQFRREKRLAARRAARLASSS